MKVICWQPLRYFLTNWLLTDGIFVLEISILIKYQVWPISYQILMNYSRNKTKQGGWGGGGWGHETWTSTRIKERTCGSSRHQFQQIQNFHGSCFLNLDWNLISKAKGCHTILCGISRSESLFHLDILRVKSQI